MEKLLKKLGLTEKEISVYLAFLQWGQNPASIIAKKIKMPKSTVLFCAENLAKSGILQKSLHGKTYLFYADPKNLQKSKNHEISEITQNLDKVIPLLQKFKTPFSSRPKLEFFEGIEGCKKLYLQLLESKTEIWEFGAHEDLENKLGKEFMQNFIKERTKKNIFLRAIASNNSIEKELHKKDKSEARDIQFFHEEKGKLYSSIAIFDDKIMILNLFNNEFGILIKNEAFSETFKTIFRLIYKI